VLTEEGKRKTRKNKTNSQIHFYTVTTTEAWVPLGLLIGRNENKTTQFSGFLSCKQSHIQWVIDLFWSHQIPAWLAAAPPRTLWAADAPAPPDGLKRADLYSGNTHYLMSSNPSYMS